MFPRLVQLVLETRWIRDGKPDQIFFLLCSLSAALWAETCYVLFPQAVLLSVFSCQILSQSPCLYVLATSRSRQGISPSTTAQPLSSCLAASRELSPMIYQLCSLSPPDLCCSCRPFNRVSLTIRVCAFLFSTWVTLCPSISSPCALRYYICVCISAHSLSSF